MRNWNGNLKAYLYLSRSQICANNAEREEYTKTDVKILNPETVEITYDGESRFLSCEKCFMKSMRNYQIYLEVIEPMLYQCLQGVHGTIFSCS
jgi:agmatine/peptidylarginine deiminase